MVKRKSNVNIIDFLDFNYYVQVEDGKIVFYKRGEEDEENDNPPIDIKIDPSNMGAEFFLYENDLGHYDHLSYGFAIGIYFAKGKYKGQAAFEDYGQGGWRSIKKVPKKRVLLKA